MSTVSDLERKVQSLRSQVAEAEKSLEAARQDDLGIHPGDIVVWKGMKCKVSSFRMWPRTGEPNRWKPWIAAYKPTKDGKWFKYTTNLYDEWEKVKCAESSDVTNK
jgi:hypothetical protein